MVYLLFPHMLHIFHISVSTHSVRQINPQQLTLPYQRRSEHQLATAPAYTLKPKPM